MSEAARAAPHRGERRRAEPLDPLRREARAALPWLAALTVASGAANTAVVVAVNSALNGRDVGAQLDLFALGAVVYLLARRAVERRLLRLSSDLVHTTRTRLLRRVLSMPFDRFERIDRAAIQTSICDDTATIASAASLVVTLLTSVVTVVVAFAYMTALNPPLAATMIAVVAGIAWAYARRTAEANRLMERARTSWNAYVGRVRDALDGFKELALHGERRAAFRAAAESDGRRLRADADAARLAYVDAFMCGETLLVTALGAVAFGFVLFGSSERAVGTGFVILLLYMIGPVRAILAAVPALAQARVAWRRIEALPLDEASPPETAVCVRAVDRLELDGLTFQYPGGLRVGPVSLAVRRGECLFITGGNGSGKTTLAKVMTGLYAADAGDVRVDGRAVGRAEAGRYFAVVFNPCFVFDQFYGTDAAGPEVARVLAHLRFPAAAANGGRIDAARLSAGQRKRAALAHAYLQDRPILVLDEVAADQDPEFRSFFYEELLDELRAAGKIAIVITHDDQYFHRADAILRLDLGRPEMLARREMGARAAAGLDAAALEPVALRP